MKRTLSLVLTLAFLLALSPNQLSALAQEPAIPDGLEDADDDAEVSRVARLSFVQGDVSFLRAGASEWAEAVENLPLMSGDQVYTASGARAEIQLARGSYIRLAEKTALTIADLSDSQSQFEVAEGTAIIRVERFASAFQRFEVDTPNSALVLKEDGLYRIEVHGDDSSEVIVRNGAAEVSTSDASFNVREGQRLLLDTGAQGRIEIAAADSRDDWDRWSSDRDSTIDRSGSAVSPDYVNTYETTYDSFYGASDLSSYGTWTDVGSYGQCWVPRVGSDWAPYRAGQWLWVPRTGWTWLSSEPWGWAPYHYGRWAFATGFGWIWSPGFQRVPDRGRFRDYRWRPALVTFFNCPTARGNYVGWYPLAPGERWRRHDRNWHAGDRSQPQLPGNRNGSNRPGNGRYGINPPGRGVTVVPLEGFTRSDRTRIRPSAPTTEVSDWIRKGARAGLPDIAPTPANSAPAFEAGDRRNSRRVAVPPGGVINRPVVTRNRTDNPVAGSQPRERRLITPRTPEFQIDVPTAKQRARKEERKTQPPAAGSGAQSNHEVRDRQKLRTSPAPPANDDTGRKPRTIAPVQDSDDASRKQRDRESGRREWKPPAGEPASGQETKPRRRTEETRPQPAEREKQPLPQPYVENKDRNRQPRREPSERQPQPEAKEQRRAPEPREAPRQPQPEAKEQRRAPEPRETPRQPEAKQAQPQQKETPRTERREERGERKKP
ncbi:MAG: DUF6600 domain-containing protein [Acidobacteriota bacterium]